MSIPKVIGPRPFFCPLLAEGDEELTIELTQLRSSQSRLEHLQRGGFRTPRRPSDRSHIVDVHIDQLAKRPQTRSALVRRHIPTINPAFGFDGPAARIIAFEEGLAYIAVLPSDLDPPWSRTEASNTSPFSCAFCVH